MLWIDGWKSTCNVWGCVSSNSHSTQRKEVKKWIPIQFSHYALVWILFCYNIVSAGWRPYILLYILLGRNRHKKSFGFLPAQGIKIAGRFQVGTNVSWFNFLGHQTCTMVPPKWKSTTLNRIWRFLLRTSSQKKSRHKGEASNLFLFFWVCGD